MSYSGLVTGCTDNRLPFCVTTIFSRPLVDFSAAREMIDAKRSANAMSTITHVGDALELAASKYLCPFFDAK